MRHLLLLSFLILSACGSTPYIGYKFVVQHNRGSDWVLQPEREWASEDIDHRFHVMAGLEWKNGYECGFEHTLRGYQWNALQCSKRFGASKGTGFYFKPSIVHQIDSHTDWFLRTDEKRWQGENPFIHLRVGYRYNGFRCPVIATGNSYRSFASGKAFGGSGEPDLYWTNVECGVRFFGKTGLWR